MNIRIKNLFFTVVCGVFSLSAVYASGCHESELLLQPNDLKKTSVSLAFPYQPIGKDETVKFVLQRGLSILKPEDSQEYIAIGTLSPCIGILLYNETNGYILGAHKHWTNNMESLATYYKQLEVENPSQVKGQIYTVHLRNYEENGWTSRHEGRSQLEELKVVKDFLVDTFRVPRNNIRARKFTSSLGDKALGDYELAELSFGMTKKGEVFSTCIMAEGLLHLKGRKYQSPLGFFYSYEQAPAEVRVGLLKDELIKEENERFFNRNTIENEKDLNTYGKVPFYYFD